VKFALSVAVERDGRRHDFAGLIAHLDRLLAEATAVREQVTAAMRRRFEKPFWPDRRRVYQQFFPERRRFEMELTEP